MLSRESGGFDIVCVNLRSQSCDLDRKTFNNRLLPKGDFWEVKLKHPQMSLRISGNSQGKHSGKQLPKCGENRHSEASDAPCLAQSST